MENTATKYNPFGISFDADTINVLTDLTEAAYEQAMADHNAVHAVLDMMHAANGGKVGADYQAVIASPVWVNHTVRREAAFGASMAISAIRQDARAKGVTLGW